MKIYAIDDYEQHLMLYTAGHGAIGFTTPDGLINALCAEQPDLLITDLMMPKIDGWTIASIARQMYPELPIIIATSMDDQVQMKYARQQGYHFWKKGDHAKLRELIEEMKKCTPSNGK